MCIFTSCVRKRFLDPSVFLSHLQLISECQSHLSTDTHIRETLPGGNAAK